MVCRQVLTLIGVAAICQAKVANAATGPKTSKSKKKSGGGGGSGPSLTKSSEKLSEYVDFSPVPKIHMVRSVPRLST